MATATTVLIVVGIVALAAFELWVFWCLGERDTRRARPGATPLQPCSSAARPVARLSRPRTRSRSWWRRSRVRSVR
jgi:hypothetical protein